MIEILKFAGPILLVHLTVFVLVILLIKRLLLNTTQQAVKTVRQVETEVRKKEAGIVRQIEEHEKELARYRAEAEETLERRRRQSEQELAQMRDKMMEEARTESEQILRRARQEEENMRQRMELALEEKAVERAGEILGMVFSDEAFASLSAVLLEELVEALSEMDADGITVDGSEIEFRSAQPLDDKQRERLGNLVKEKFGIDAVVQEKVDETLLGGLAFKLGSLDIDGSLRHRLLEAQEMIRKGEG